MYSLSIIAEFNLCFENFCACACLGSCLYRFLVAVALRLNVPAEALKLVSAIIVAIAIAFPFLKKKVAFVRQKSAAQKKLKDNMRLAEANTKEMGGDR